MAKDELTYSEAVRAAAAEAAAALGTSPEVFEQRTRTETAIDAEIRVVPGMGTQKDKAPRKRTQPPDARTIAMFEACIDDLRSLLTNAEERSAKERSRCDRLLDETLIANARAARLEGELTALRSRPVPWWRRWREANCS